MNIAKYEPLKASSYIPLPEVLANKKTIINLKNEDNRCLEWALLSILYYDEHNSLKLSSYKKHLGKLDFKGIGFPTPLSQIPKLEKQNPDLAINVYGYALSPKKQKIRVFPYYISDRPQKIPRVNLLLISEDVEVDYGNDEVDETYGLDDESMVDENYDPADHEDYPEPKKKETKYHYCGIRNLNRLLFDQTKHKTKTYFCDRCLYGFTKEDLLTKHKEDCYGINTGSTRIDMPAEGTHIKFNNYQNQIPVPYVIYADFESIIKPKTDKAGDKSEITSEHEACGFGYQVVRYDGQAEEPVIYRGKNVVEAFLNHLECVASNINNTFAHPKPPIMTEQYQSDYNQATQCWICEQKITTHKVKTATSQAHTKVQRINTATTNSNPNRARLRSL